MPKGDLEADLGHAAFIAAHLVGQGLVKSGRKSISQAWRTDGVRDAVATAKTAASEQAGRDVDREGHDDRVEQESNQSVHGCQPAQLPRRDLYVRHLKCHSYH